MVTEFITVDNAHWYPSPKNPEVYYPSVTTILSVFPKDVGFNKYLTAQTSWESSQEILKAAGQRGTNVHKATERLEHGETLVKPEFTVQEWQMLIGFVGWHKTTSPDLLEMEHGLVSDKHKTGGTIDRIYEFGDEKILLDIKTSGAIYDNYWVQTAAYAQMYEEKHKTIITHTAILRLSDRKKNGFEYATRNREEWKEDFKIFKAVHKLWNYTNPNAKPKILELPNELKLNNDIAQ